MVESVGSKAKAGEVSLGPVARVVTSTPAKPVASEAPAATSTARTLAAAPPVDAERVRRIKAAVESGSFPISPARIADRLIALKYEWGRDDQA